MNICLSINHTDTLGRRKKVVRQFNLRIQCYFRSQIQPLKKGLKCQVQKKYRAFKLSNIRNGRYSLGLYTHSLQSINMLSIPCAHMGIHLPSLLHATLIKDFKARQQHLHWEAVLPEHFWASRCYYSTHWTFRFTKCYCSHCNYACYRVLSYSVKSLINLWVQLGSCFIVLLLDLWHCCSKILTGYSSRFNIGLQPFRS